MPVELNRPEFKIEVQPYLTVRTQFIDDDTGRPVSVQSATFKVLDYNTRSEVSVRQHHLPYVNYPTQGWVQADIDTSNLQANQKYVFRFEVVDSANRFLSKESVADMFEATREQWLIDQLRTLLLDKPAFSQWMPQHLHQRYLIRKPWEVEWQNEELYTYLMTALSDINNAVPTDLSWDLATCPAVSFLLKGGMVYALLGRGLVEVYNYYDTNAPVKVTLYKGDKLNNFMQWVYNDYTKRVETWKKAYAIYESSTPKALVLTKLPFTVVRPLSMMYGYGNLYQW